ncbi:hypothetical protein T492DRAFT_1090174, partial [Pavlovales sp. CCMP2436]
MARVASTSAPGLGEPLLLAKGEPLRRPLGPIPRPHVPPPLLPQDKAAWQAVRSGCFMLGGVTFLFGTTCYYYPSWAEGAAVSAWLYTVGSFSFLGVDALELITYVRTHLQERWLHRNIALSCLGSLLYVIGSYGFVPWLAAAQPLVGILGFVLGSAAIGTSQLWKTVRIARDYSRAVRVDYYVLEPSQSWAASANAIGVELSAGLGGWSFFFGTLVYAGGGWAD